MFLPFIRKTAPRRQLDPIECGAVCLGIILETFGYFATNQQLQQACKTSRGGSDAASLIKAAQQFSLDARARRLLASEIQNERALSILFFDGCHFVVFEGFFLGRFYINDPAQGRYSLNALEFKRRYSNVALTFTKNAAFRPNKPVLFIPTLDGSIRFALITLGLFLGVVLVIFSAVIGALAVGNVRINLWWALFCIILIALVGLVYGAFWRMIRYVATKACRNEFFELSHGLENISLAFFEDIKFGEIKRIFVTTFSRSFSAVSHSATQHVSFAFIIVIFGAIFWISSATAFALGLSFLLLSIQAFFGRMIINAKDEHSQDLLYTTLFQASDMRAMGQTDILIDSLLNKERCIIGFRKWWLDVLLSPLVPIFIFLAFFGFAINTGEQASWAEIIAMLILSYSFFYSAKNIYRQIPQKALHESATFRREIAGLSDRKIILHVSHDQSLLQLKKVSFSFRGEDKEIWQGIDIEILRGEMVGVVGPPLSGISTLLRLIGGKLHWTEGEIIHYSSTPSPLRVAHIDDDADIMDASLKDNLTFFDHTISEQAMVQALEQACATDIFYDRPMGLLTHISASGNNLSAGQKKRLLLAQALIQKPDLVILDHFFATLDEMTSLKILGNLYAQKITTVFSSFQESELKKADRIILIVDQKTLIFGQHDFLIKTNEQYRQLLSSAPKDNQR